MVSTSLPVIVVSYGGREERLTLSVRPRLELNDAEAGQAAEHVWKSLREMFALAADSELTLHETESGRTMSKESFRDPVNLLSFPKFWYLTVENSATLGFRSLDVEEVPATDSNDLIDLLDMQDLSHSDVDEGDFYPSLVELSMDQNSPALGSPSEDLIPITLSCNESGEFGIVLRHFTVLANIPLSEQSGSEGGSRTNSRCSTHSSESHDTLRMSTVFVHCISPGSPAESSGLRIGDVIYSINGQSVNKCAVDELRMLLSEGHQEIVLWVSADRQDDLLFLYPQYIHGEAGEYERSANEKVLVTDIEARVQHGMGMRHQRTVTSDPNINMEPFAPLHIRSVSADDRFFCDLNSFPFGNSYDSFQQLVPSDRNNSAASIDSEEPNGLNLSSDDLLITGSLADIPIEGSPGSLKRVPRNNLTSLGVSRHQMAESFLHNSFPGEDPEQVELIPEWFPNSGDMKFLDSFPSDGSYSSNTVITESGFDVKPAVGGKSKIAKLKQSLRNLTGSSPEPKARESGTTMNQTNSTSALDRMRVNSTEGSFTPRSHRSFSTELGISQIQRPDRLSLQFSTGMSPTENTPSTFSSLTGSGHYQARPESDILMSKPQFMPTGDIQQSSPVRSSEGSDISDSSFSSFLHLSQEHGRQSSGESLGMGFTRGRHRDRSYQSQRQRLHKRSSVMSRGASSEEVGSPTSVPTSRNSLVSKKPLHRKPQRAAAWSKQPSPFSRRKNYNPDEVVVSPPSHNSLDFAPLGTHVSEYSATSHNALSRTEPHKESLPRDSVGTDKNLLSPTIEITNVDPNTTHKMSSNLKPIRRTISATSSTVKRKVDLSSSRRLEHSYEQTDNLLSTTSKPLIDGGTIRSPKEFEVRREGKRRLEGKSSMKADFHGPVHKKQVREGGKKAQDRSWRPLYAAIRGHHLLFYENAHVARNGTPLSHEPSLDLHQSIMVYPASKQRPFVFGLTLPGGNECLIQAESEESMMMWTRIIHNLNRWHRRMPASGVPHQIHHSQELPRSKLHVTEKKQSQERSRTPQPPAKKDEPSKTHFKKIIQKLRANNKDIPYSVDASYITFGVPLEDCPASVENKRIPLILSVCVEEIEKNWLDTEGLYRVAGPIKQVKSLCAELDKGDYARLQGHTDAHTITSTLKKFLKELPDPVIPNDRYNDFVSCGRDADREDCMKRLQELVDELPVVHFHTLAFLIRHLKKVETLSKQNKMDQNNLCLVFGPTVIRKADDAGLVCDMKACYKVMELFMGHCHTFFKRFFDIYDQRERQTMSAFEKRNALRRGVSDPSQLLEEYGIKPNARRSWDGSARIFSQGSQPCDSSLLSNELLASQGRSKSHFKPRLGSTRQMLTNQSPEDSGSEHTNSVPRNATLISPTMGYTAPKPPVSRKVSYSEAMQHGRMFMDPVAEDKPSHIPVHMANMGRQQPPRRFSSIVTHSRLYPSSVHHYSLENRHDTELISKVNRNPYWSFSEYPPRNKN